MDWNRLSFPEQLGNIGAELSRAKFWDEKGNSESRDRSLERALDLVRLTLDCQVESWPRLREVARFGEVLAGVYAGVEPAGSTLEYLDGYCLEFAILAKSDSLK